MDSPMNQVVSLHTAMITYNRLLQQGELQQAYRGLMEFMLGLRSHFDKNHPELALPSSIYAGTMDMTYFSCVTPALREHKLKIAVVFLHQAFRFEVWLAGVNKKVQFNTWKGISDSGWDRYALVEPLPGVDAILTHILVPDPDFRDLEALTTRIEAGVLDFIRDVETFLCKDSL